MTRTKSMHLTLLAVLLSPMVANAVPVQIGAGDFGAGATTVDFDTFACGFGDPTIPGVTISGAGGIAEVNGAGSGCATWGSSSDPGRQSLYWGQGLSVDLDGGAVDRVGFVFGGNTDNVIDISLWLDGVVTGTFTLTSSPGAADGINNWIFYGFEDFAGIDRITFGNEQNNDWAVGLYDLTYEIVSVPEPGTLALLGIGLLGMGAARRKKA